MNQQKFLGAFAVAVTWLFVLYLIVSMLVFWTALQRDWNQLSVQVVLRNLRVALLWIKELFS
jgi:hypothetical protein